MLTSCQLNPHHFTARVVDFGLACSNSPVDRVTQNMYGTVTHMAPELMAGAPAGPVSNIFAVIVITITTIMNNNIDNNIDNDHDLQVWQQLLGTY